MNKLCRGAPLTEADKTVLLDLTRSVRRAEKGRDIAVPGDSSRSLPVILRGWACRYQVLANGKRQIVMLYLPGDMCEPFGLLPHFIDDNIAALTPVSFSTLSQDVLRTWVERSPTCKQALWWDLLVATNIERAQIVSLGRRSAAERLGHLFCEIELRLRMAGIPTESGCDMPLTQVELADLLGLTPVHVNRSLQDLRKAGLISLENRRLIIREHQELRDLSDFDPCYLHVNYAQTSPEGWPHSLSETIDDA
ncbi:helix-turn-helix domain-containing protein [Sphingomonas arenae]|uniref:helix-turn-helix domain-containing protein n=1 Tax=Sphingomonas arenae TaxID=2812555 RepID=UPI0019672968